MRTRTAVVTAAVLAALVGGGVVADGAARERTESDLAVSVQQQVPGLASEPDVTIQGFPFFTQVLGGELEEVRISAPLATVDGLALHQVEVTLEGVSTSVPTTARLATMTASARLEDLSGLLALDAELTVEDGFLVATTSFLGLPVAVRLTPRPAGRAIEADVESVVLAGVVVGVERLPAVIADRLDGLSVPIDGLPEGMLLTAVTPTATGLDLESAGTDVVLAQPVP